MSDISKSAAKRFDAVVIGAGHAGIEAGLCLARKGHKTLLATISLNAIGLMPCNPNIGGTAKAQIVRDIDALGGEMGKIADAACIQIKMLNAGNGVAVQSLRAQSDKLLYHRAMKRVLERQENLCVLESEITEILTENGAVTGVKTALGEKFSCRAVVLCTGVYLKSRIIIGDYSKEEGPSGYAGANRLSENLSKLGLPLRRFKTGTPMRVKKSTVDFSKTVPQYGDRGLPAFSGETDFTVRNDAVCYLTYTNENTHKIILDNLDRSPLYNGNINGIGPRYCPSIEVKVVRFPDKERHQIFIEPEGSDTDEMYIQGLSTSLPYDVQEKMLHSVAGLENAEIMRYGYAIEYDCLDPEVLLPTLAVKGFKGLYSAGQINGSSGYEEAAGQGLVAGINCALYLENKGEFILSRDESYIGVLIDDLVTKGTDEPYRMMTSRAEYRLILRQDNADLRLLKKGYDLGLISQKRYEKFLNACAKKEELLKKLERRYSPKMCKEPFEAAGESPPKSGVSGAEILRRGNLDVETLKTIDPDFRGEDDFILGQIETEIKYEGYIKKQMRDVEEMKKLEAKKLSPDLDYTKIDGLRKEAAEKLQKIHPASLAQASRISGVNPADVTVLLIFLAGKKTSGE